MQPNEERPEFNLPARRVDDADLRRILDALSLLGEVTATVNVCVNGRPVGAVELEADQPETAEEAPAPAPTRRDRKSVV